MEPPKLTTLDDIIEKAKIKLEKLALSDDAQKAHEATLSQFIHISHDLFKAELQDELKKLCGAESFSSSDDSLLKDELALQVAELFAEGLLQAIQSVEQYGFSQPEALDILQRCAMYISTEVQTLALKSIQASAERYKNTNKQLMAARFIGSTATQLYIKHGQPEKKAKLQERAKTKNLWIRLYGWINEGWMKIATGLFKDEPKREAAAWFPLACFGPFFCWYAGNRFIQSEFVPILYGLPALVLVIFYLYPLTQQGLFRFTRTQLLFIALSATILLALNWLNGLFLTGLSLLIFGFYFFNFFLQQDIKQQKMKLEKAEEEAKEKAEDAFNPNLMYDKLGVKPIYLQFGDGLLPMVDPDQKNEILGKLIKLRNSLTDELGFILPNVRIWDNSQLGENEFTISIRDVLTLTGIVYPDRVMLPKNRFTQNQLEIPPDAIEGKHPIYPNETVLWVLSSQISECVKKDAQQASEVIIQAIKISAIRHVSKIFTLMDGLKYLVVIRRTLGEHLVDKVMPGKMSATNFQRFLFNLIREKVSIKDSLLVFERLLDHTQFEEKPDLLSEKLRQDFRKSICYSVANGNKEIAVIELSTGWEKALSRQLKQTNYGFEIITDNATRFRLIVQIASLLSRAKKQHEKPPVLLCDSSIRLPLFRLLEEDLPDLVILARQELCSDFKKNILDTIEPIS